MAASNDMARAAQVGSTGSGWLSDFELEIC
jgi:hypothetical protein